MRTQLPGPGQRQGRYLGQLFFPGRRRPQRFRGPGLPERRIGLWALLGPSRRQRRGVQLHRVHRQRGRPGFHRLRPLPAGRRFHQGYRWFCRRLQGRPEVCRAGQAGSPTGQTHRVDQNRPVRSGLPRRPFPHRGAYRRGLHLRRHDRAVRGDPGAGLRRATGSLPVAGQHTPARETRHRRGVALGRGQFPDRRHVRPGRSRPSHPQRPGPGWNKRHLERLRMGGQPRGRHRLCQQRVLSGNHGLHDQRARGGHIGGGQRRGRCPGRAGDRPARQ